nr:spore cortex-lytic enzyme [Ammoniphilus oxalaticus]
MAFIACLAFLLLFTSQPPTEAASLVKMGSANGDVWDLQFRLNTAGYYTEKPDGHFGAVTADAVRRFQRSYGLPADGVVGAQTWTVLKKVSVNRAELDQLAKLIYSEARGESYTGQVAVGAVVMNRLRSKEFPNSIAAVIFQPRAFTAIDDGQFWLTPNATAYRAALDAVRGWDPSNGCLYYFNPHVATSKWIWTRPQKITIGSHIFCM